MSIEAAIGRIDQIIAMQRQLVDPASAAAAKATPTQAAGAVSTGATTPSFAGTLAAAQAAPATDVASAPPTGYVNPLANASVTPERIDQGVDYAGSGTLGAIGPGVVTQVVASGSGWEGGGFVAYKLTAGPHAGKTVFYAEGVTPNVSVGQTLAAGQQVATIIPGAPHGIEIGWGSDKGELSYASAYGGGYNGSNPTAAGKSFSDLVASLGGPAGLTEGKPVTGNFS